MTTETPTTTTIKGRTYAIEEQHTGPHLARHLIAQGWEGTIYLAIGKRSAMFLAVRSAGDGHFERMV